MAYNPNIPQPTDNISKSQADILNNFTTINTLVSVDHKTFSDPNYGKHAKVSLIAAAAPAASPATEVGIYCKTLNANSELYINKTGTQIPFTAALKASPGWAILASGIIMKWGSGYVAGGGNTTLNFVVEPEATFTVAPVCTISGVYTAPMTSPVVLNTITTTTVSVHNLSNTGTTFYYIAIGY